MRRYKFLDRDEIFLALNKVRDALLAAKDGNDVEQIMNGLFTFDERVKLGRRILIAEYLRNNFSPEEIQKQLKVGKSTIAFVSRNLDEYEKCFNLIQNRNKKIEISFKEKGLKKTGGSLKVFKKKEYTGFSRKDVKR